MLNSALVLEAATHTAATVLASAGDAPEEREVLDGSTCASWAVRPGATRSAGAGPGPSRRSADSARVRGRPVDDKARRPGVVDALPGQPGLSTSFLYLD